MPLPESILWQNQRGTVVLLDLPRTLEEAQVASADLGTTTRLKRIISAAPLETPYQTPEPTDGGYSFLAANHSAQVTELMTRGYAGAALEEIHDSYTGPWYLPRVTNGKQEIDSQPRETSEEEKQQHLEKINGPSTAALIPPYAEYFLGTIQDRRADVIKHAPFDLIVMDPPWPNRSARRKRNNYQTSDDFYAMRDLLSLIPIKSHLKPDGLVAVWITNSPRVTEQLTSPGGVFEEWGVELVGEWTWVKVTTQGESIVCMDSQWRKPWERLLIAARPGRQGKSGYERRVIVSVPDVHSRKPNLRGLFEPLLPADYTASEVFARSLTAGWCAWGDEVLHFQQSSHWVVEDSHKLTSGR